MIIYNIGLRFLHFFIWVGSFFNAKAKLFVDGRKETFEKLNTFKNSLGQKESIYWFHCASLGEFEQARPLIEEYKHRHPDIKIAISFFSPSGYEVQKKYALADIVFYLPMASKTNALKVLDVLKPEKIFFIKYEFWLNYINEAYKQRIPVYLVCALFNPQQFFFQWYGKIFLNILPKYAAIFVQDEASVQLLEKYNIKSIACGDTRFDRVLTNKAKAKKNELIESFANGKKIIVLGSSWPTEEELIFSAKEELLNYKIIIAPHDISRNLIIPSHLRSIKYSEASTGNIADAEVLIIDNIGMLASLYSYAYIAFVGGGFRASLHNILEAAVFGIPVIYGNQTIKHPEAEALQEAGGGIIISDLQELKTQLTMLLSNSNKWAEMAENAALFVAKNTGATQKILNEI